MLFSPKPASEDEVSQDKGADPHLKSISNLIYNLIHINKMKNNVCL